RRRVRHADQDRRLRRLAARIDDAHAGGARTGHGVGVLDADAGAVVERAVAVEIPFVARPVAVGIARLRGIELHGERRLAAGRRGADARHRRLVAAEVADAAQRAGVQRQVVEIAARADDEVHRAFGAGDEVGTVGGVRLAVFAGEDDPDAFAAVVGEEQRAVVRARVVA